MGVHPPGTPPTPPKTSSRPTPTWEVAYPLPFDHTDRSPWPLARRHRRLVERGHGHGVSGMACQDSVCNRCSVRVSHHQGRRHMCMIDLVCLSRYCVSLGTSRKRSSLNRRAQSCHPVGSQGVYMGNRTLRPPPEDPISHHHQHHHHDYRQRQKQSQFLRQFVRIDCILLICIHPLR